MITVLVLAAFVVDLPKIPTISIPNTKIQISLFGGGLPIKFGLDLQGGTELVLQTQMQSIKPEDRDDALESGRQFIE